MRRVTDRLYLRDDDRPLRPSERRAVHAIRQAPGLTIEQLRTQLGVGQVRVWQILDRLEWLEVVRRDGDAPRRQGLYRRPPPARTAWRRSAGVGCHQAIDTMLALERLAVGPVSAPTLSQAIELSYRSTLRLLRRLEHDGYVERLHGPPDRYGPLPRLSTLGRQLHLAPYAPPAP